jgi:hypothetical protein
VLTILGGFNNFFFIFFLGGGWSGGGGGGHGGNIEILFVNEFNLIIQQKLKRVLNC